MYSDFPTYTHAWITRLMEMNLTAGQCVRIRFGTAAFLGLYDELPGSEMSEVDGCVQVRPYYKGELFPPVYRDPDIDPELMIHEIK